LAKWEYLTISRNRSWTGTHKDHYIASEWEDTILTPSNPGGAEKQTVHLTTGLLNNLGSEGWELVSITDRSDYLGGEKHGEITRDFAGFTTNELWVFKRPKPE